jgi:hypothetical protein
MGRLQLNSNLSKNNRISIIKANSTKLKPYSINGGVTVYDDRAVYVFKGGSTNTISTVFNFLELVGSNSSSNADLITIATNGVGKAYWYKNSGLGGTGWREITAGSITNQANTVINVNDLIYFSPRSLKEISVGSGAIIQRDYNGNANLNRTGLYSLISTGSYIFARGSNNTIASFSNSSEFVGNNIISLADRIAIKSPGDTAFLLYYLRGDGITWRRSGSTTTQNDTIIQNNSLITYTTYNSVVKQFTVQGDNVVRISG